MKLEDIGYDLRLDPFREELRLENLDLGRVIAEHKERYTVRTENGECEAEITGKMRFTARHREDFPAVGDWVALTTYDPDFAVIHKILPRFSTIKRQEVGQFGETQVIATNIDYALLVQAVDRDFNINRLERYLAICHAAGVRPIIILSKTDLVKEPQLTGTVDLIKLRTGNIPIIAISNQTQTGYEALKNTIQKGRTYCMLGSSGVGKTTLLNNLSGGAQLKTDAISQRTGKGRHTTTHRELILLENGGILIDNPGMREVGIADAPHGLEITFDRIEALSHMCKFNDCTHTQETGCAVRKAVDSGKIDEASYENYLKLEREKKHFETTVAEKRKKEKEFGKMIKNYYKTNPKDK